MTRAEDRLAVAQPRRMQVALERDQARVREQRRELAALRERHRAIRSAVDHERGHRARGGAPRARRSRRRPRASPPPPPASAAARCSRAKRSRVSRVGARDPHVGQQPRSGAPVRAHGGDHRLAQPRRRDRLAVRVAADHHHAPHTLRDRARRTRPRAAAPRDPEQRQFLQRRAHRPAPRSCAPPPRRSPRVRVADDPTGPSRAGRSGRPCDRRASAPMNARNSAKPHSSSRWLIHSAGSSSGGPGADRRVGHPRPVHVAEPDLLRQRACARRTGLPLTGHAGTLRARISGFEASADATRRAP